jgi:hypothetical protein
MNGEGFAFACWVRLSIATYDWNPDSHGWNCYPCRIQWESIRRATARTGADHGG